MKVGFFFWILISNVKNEIKTRMTPIGTNTYYNKKRGFFLEFGFAL